MLQSVLPCAAPRARPSRREDREPFVTADGLDPSASWPACVGPNAVNHCRLAEATVPPGRERPFAHFPTTPG
jgi:hypothetical protein